MIAIVNVSEELRETGPHEYEVRINSKVIARFTHNREDSLPICLSTAANAVEFHRGESLYKYNLRAKKRR